MLEVSENKDYKKKQEALVKRLESLGKGNPIVTEAVEKATPKEDDFMEGFEPVEALVRAARGKYYEGDMKLNEVIKKLSEALAKLAQKQ